MTEPQPPALRLLKRFGLELFLGVLVVTLFAGYLFSDQLLYGSDSIPAGLFFRGLLVDFVKEFGEIPRWNPYILGGLPFIDATHGDTFFPSALLQFTMPVYRALGHKLVLHIFLAGVFMAFYLRSLRLHPSAVTVGALVYMLSPVFVSYLFAGQDGKMYVTSMAPLVLGLLERAMRKGTVRSFAALGLATGFLILSAQIQMAYHCLWFVGALFVLRWFRGAVGVPDGEAGMAAAPPRAKTALLAAAAMAAAVLVASVQLFPAVSYVKHPDGFSVRSSKTDYEHASSWSLHPEEVAQMIVPEFSLAPVPSGYFGRNVFKYNSDYVGLLTLFLAGLALARKRDATRWFLGGMAVFAVLYSLGEHTPLHRLFFHVVPQVKIFRAPPLVMFAAAFGFSALAAHAVHDLESAAPGKKDADRLARRVLVWGLGIGGAVALLGVAGKPFLAFWKDLFLPDLAGAKLQAMAVNGPAFTTGALMVALVLAAGAALVSLRLRGKVNGRLLLIGLVILMILDLWRVDRWFIKVMEPDRWIRADPIIAAISEESAREKFRVAPIIQGYSTNELGYFGVESVFGFHDNELAWYRELRSDPQAQNLLFANENGYPFLQVLNVKYVIHNQPNVPNPMPVDGYLPRFRLVDRYEIIPDRADITARIADPAFHAETTAILEEAPGFEPQPGAGPPGRVTSYEYDGNRIVAQVVSDRPSLLIHAENWFPYWKAYIDDGEARMLRAYGSLRAIPLPAGSHTVELRFHSAPFELGKYVSLVTIALLLLAVGVPMFRRRNPAG